MCCLIGFTTEHNQCKNKKHFATRVSEDSVHSQRTVRTVKASQPAATIYVSERRVGKVPHTPSPARQEAQGRVVRGVVMIEKW